MSQLCIRKHQKDPPRGSDNIGAKLELSETRNGTASRICKERIHRVSSEASTFYSSTPPPRPGWKRTPKQTSLSVLNRAGHFEGVGLTCDEGIACTIEICLMKFVCTPSIQKQLLKRNCQQMALKQDGVHFALCPKQGNKIEGVVLNRVRLSNPYRLTSIFNSPAARDTI